MSNRVLVILSTYNGERYLAEQLDSLYAQKGVDINILVRDDGSKDKTIDILKKYQNNRGKISIIEGRNIGAGPSFMALINEAATDYPFYDYYAFCDQDDVWFPTKLSSGVKAMEESKKERKFYFCGSINTDADLHPIASSSVRQVNSFGANLVANHILGCCMMFNGKLLEDINKINSRPFAIPNGQVPIHDAWAALVAYTLEADVIQSGAAQIYYRQHGSNVIGGGKGYWSIQKNRVKRYLSVATHGKANKCIIALQVLGDEIPEKNRELMELVASYRDSLRSKICLMFDKRMYEYGTVDNIGTFLTLLFNKF